MPLSGALSWRRFRRSSRTRSEHRDAWRKVVKRIVTNGQKIEYVHRILMHEREIRENRKMQYSADVSRNQTACSRGEVVFPTTEINASLTASRRLDAYVAPWKRASCEQRLDLLVFERDQRDVTDGMQTVWKLPVDVASKNHVCLSSTCPEFPVENCLFDPILFEVIRMFSAMRLNLVL